MTNIDPPDAVPDGQTTKWRGLYQKCVTRKFDNFAEESKREQLREEIETAKQHRKLVSYAIFPFSQGNPGGYKFVALEPLNEIGLKNFDFLLYDTDGHAILGEAKSSIPKAPRRIVNQVAKRKQVALEHLEYIEREYLGVEEEFLGEEIDHVEFVLVTYAQHASIISNEIAKSGEEVITWGVEPTSDTLWVQRPAIEEFPDNIEADDPDEMLEELNLRLKHSDQILNSALDRTTTAIGQVNILPNAPPVDQLRIVIQARRVVDRFPCVDRADLVEEVEESMLNYGRDRVEEIVNELIISGKEIDFLSEWEDDRAEFKIVSNYTSRDDLETVLLEKWIDHRISQMKDELRRECLERVTDDVGRQRQLSEFAPID